MCVLLSLLVALSPAATAESRITDAVVADRYLPGPIALEVVLSEKRLNVRLGSRVVRSYPVAIGTLDYPTPEGEYLIDQLIWNPRWHPPASDWAKGEEPKRPGDPDNPMRIVKIPFDSPYYYIHGTNQPTSIGTMASHGCLRMTERDVRELGTFLMRWSGESSDETWLRGVLASGESRRVELEHPIPITIRMGAENIYPGVVWDLETASRQR